MIEHTVNHGSVRGSIMLFVIASIPICAVGCSDGPTVHEVRGQVFYESKPVEKGDIRFIPIDGTKGQASYGTIIDGKYEITARGGVSVGKHRVEIQAFRKTGRKVPGKPPATELNVDEMTLVGPKVIGSSSSPLVVSAAEIQSGAIDFTIPRE
jgi:hypothetical protein